MSDARDEPCAACPWRTANQGKRHPDGWYTKANLRRLWAGLRRGEHMSCHPTDPANPVSDRAQKQGHKPAPKEAASLHCIGAYIVQQREFMVVQNVYRGDLKAYRRDRPRGLTREGICVVLQDALFGGTIMGGDGIRIRPNLNSPVSVPDLDWPLGNAANQVAGGVQ